MFHFITPRNRAAALVIAAIMALVTVASAPGAFAAERAAVVSIGK